MSKTLAFLSVISWFMLYRVKMFKDKYGGSLMQWLVQSHYKTVSSFETHSSQLRSVREYDFDLLQEKKIPQWFETWCHVTVQIMNAKVNKCSLLHVFQAMYKSCWCFELLVLPCSSRSVVESLFPSIHPKMLLSHYLYRNTITTQPVDN